MKPIIRVENISKRYQIGSARSSHNSIREHLTDTMRSSLKRVAQVGRKSRRPVRGDESFWALKDVSFEVQPGEVVGIIGRNGAGKSTLLKILSRITDPTAGRIELYGRVRSLLEVGTGFHPELSGRENIYLNGAILGMQRAEITTKFDEIVAFAEIEQFLDVPVKRYSSGMYTRLAFAVAAHLEPEILIVDEVLAVGDMAFQRKCLNKMQDVGRQGRTVLFVSHDMSSVTRLCRRVVLLSEGAVVLDEEASQAVSVYLNSHLSARSERHWSELSSAPGNEVVRLRNVRVCTEGGQTADAIDIRRPVGVEMTYDVLKAGHILVPNYHLHNEHGTCIFVVQELEEQWRHRPRSVERYTSTVWIPGNFLAEGTVIVTAAISTYFPMTVHVFEREAVAFQVVDSLDGDSARGDYAGPMPGIVRPVLIWTTQTGGSRSPDLPSVNSPS